MQWREELTRRFPALTGLAHCYVVGGAIRDLLMGREPADVDVACHDPLAAAKSLAGRMIALGNQEHLRAWRVVHRGHVYDFAELLDHSIGADLARRDFTVNAMAVRLEDGTLLDPHGGRQDLEVRLVRMVQPSNFDDDPLRTLKGVRMAVKYGMAVDEKTRQAIRERAPRILEMAAERVSYELSIIFASGALRKAIQLLRETGLAEPLGLRTPVLYADDVSMTGAFALLVEDPRAFGERWRWSDALTRDVITLQHLVDRHDRLALYDAGETLAAQLPGVLRALGRDEPIDRPDFSQRALLSGDEIARIASLAPGKELGRIKRALLEAQVRGEVADVDEAKRLVERLTASA
jgi:hypothetical protein